MSCRPRGSTSRSSSASCCSRPCCGPAATAPTPPASSASPATNCATGWRSSPAKTARACSSIFYTPASGRICERLRGGAALLVLQLEIPQQELLLARRHVARDRHVLARPEGIEIDPDGDRLGGLVDGLLVR